MHYTLFIPPSVGVVGLAEYVCTHPILYFLQKKIQTLYPTTLSRGTVLHPALPVDGVTRRRYRMAQDSDDFLFIFNIIACVWIVILAIVALLCSLLRRVVRWWTIWCNKCVISLLGLMFVSHLSLLSWGDASITKLYCYMLPSGSNTYPYINEPKSLI